MNKTTRTVAGVLAGVMFVAFAAAGGAEPRRRGRGGARPAAPAAAPAAPSAAPAAPAAPAGQWTLEEREFWVALQNELNDYVRQMNSECGTNVTASYLQETFRGRMTAGGSYGLDSYTRSTCAAPLTALRSICQSSAASRQAVAAQVRHVECGWGATNYSLSNGTVRMMFNTDANNASGYETEFTTWVRRHL